MESETKGLVVGVIWTLSIIGVLFWTKKESEEKYTVEDSLEDAWENNR